MVLQNQAHSSLSFYFFAAAIALAPLQLYTLPVAGFYPSLAMLAGYACYLALSPNSLRNAPACLYPLMAMLGWMVMAIALRPDKMFLIKILFYNAFFPAVLLAGYRVKQLGKRWLMPFYVALVFAVINAVLILIFRVHQPFEQAFYELPITRLFINPNRIMYTLANPELVNSFIDPRKAGGVFPNANYAAVFLGVTSLLGFGLYKFAQKRWLLPVSLFLLAVMPIAGSKAAYPAAVIIAVWLTVRLVGMSRFLPLCCLCIGLFFSLAVGSDSSRFSLHKTEKELSLASSAQRSVDYHSTNAQNNFHSRIRFWNYSVELISKRPLLGNSSQHLADIGDAKFRRMQSHNVYLKLGVYFGIPALLCAVLFHFGMMRTLWMKSRRLTGGAKDFCFSAFLAFGWVVAQGWISNAEPVGEFHTSALLAGMVGVVLALQETKSEMLLCE